MELKKLGSRVGTLVKKYRYVLIVLLVGIGLMLMPDGQKQEQSAKTAASQDFPDQTEALTEILSDIEGAGKVRVLLSPSGGARTLFQLDEDIDADGSVSAQTVIVTDGQRSQQGLIQQILAPEYRGAIVLCQGAGDASVRLAIVEAVSDATGLSTDRISVLKMK